MEKVRDYSGYGLNALIETYIKLDFIEFIWAGDGFKNNRNCYGDCYRVIWDKFVAIKTPCDFG